MKPFDVEMGRRTLGKSALLGLLVASGGALSARAATAAKDPNENIIFTGADPAHWAGKEATHVPTATVAGSALTVKTPHPQSDTHFIVSHSVILADGTYLGRAVFTPKDEPTSQYTLPAGYKGKVTVTSTCNLHDFWVNTITV